jgi:hypothetical protein
MGSLENSETDVALAGEMTPAELDVCQFVKSRFCGVLEGKLDFAETVKLVFRVLHSLGRREFNLEAALAGLNEGQVAASLGRAVSDLTPDQRQFAQDINGMIDFAIRNGWGFPTVLSILGHDLSDLLHYNADLNRATADGWQPKASGWAKLNSANFGQSDEQGD